MEEENSEKNWRKEVDEHLKRLHSLQFGADAAMERRDFSTAHILSLRLVGFLESRAVADPLDEKLTRPIRADALSKLDTARRSLLPSSNLRAFEQAKRVHGTTFNGKGDMDVEKIKQSKYFRALLQQHNIRLRTQSGEKLESQNLSDKTPKIIEKNFSLYGSNITEAKMGPTCSLIGRKNKSPENCEIIDKAGFNQNNPTSFRFSGSEKVDEGRSNSYPSGSKRPHEQIAGPRNDSLKSNEENGVDSSGKGFVTARAKLEMDVRQKRGWNGLPSVSGSPQSDNANKSYGVRSNAYLRRGIRGNFIPPIKSNGGNGGTATTRVVGKSDDALDDSTRKCLEMLCGPDGELPEKLRNLEPRLIEHVSNEIMDRDPSVRWDDIAGLEHAKKCVTEMVIWPLLRPDIFKGCRSPGRGLLLFGPPGTGKTMIGKAIAGEAKATFFLYIY